MSDKKPDAAPAAEKGDGHDAAPAAGGGGGGMKAMMPAIIAIVMAPAATWGVANFVLLPKFKASVAEAVAAADPEAAAKAAAAGHGAAGHGAKPAPAKKEEKGGGHGGGHGGGKGKDAADPSTYKFENVVVNLSGTMGTRYLKATFLITSDKPDLNERFTAAKPQLTDVTLAVLSSLTLADLEEAGSKNIIRERLIASYNQALGGKVAENLYFSEFVVQ
jgi:flagellar FliL protein